MDIESLPIPPIPPMLFAALVGALIPVVLMTMLEPDPMAMPAMELLDPISMIKRFLSGARF